MNVQQRQLIDGGKPFDDVEDIVEMRRIATYFRDMARTNGARLLIAETNASRSRQLIEQKTRGFSLLSRMSSDFLATAEPAYLTRVLAGHLNSILNMKRTVVLMRERPGSGFRILASAGYSDSEQKRLQAIDFHLPRHIDNARRIVSTLSPLAEADRQTFAALDIPYFIAIPIIAEEELKALIVTGRMREQRPFSPPLNLSDMDTLRAIGGFFGAYLARYALIERDREQSRDRIAEVERLVTQRTAEIERQRGLLDESLRELHETQQRLIMREKLASLGQLVTGIAHEIRNPLNFVNNFSDLSLELVMEIEELIEEFMVQAPVETREEFDDLFQTLRSNLGIIANHGKRAASIVRNMLQHARDDNGRSEIADINSLLTESLEFAYHIERAQDKQFDVVITRDLDPGIKLLNIVPQQVSRVFVNLLTNAFSAMKKRIFESDPDYSPMLTVTTRRLTQEVEVRMRDNGTGIPADIRPKIFSPFFTTKSPGEGTGLGLSLCYDIIVNAHGGAIEIESEENAFTEVIIRLPLAPVSPRLGYRPP